MTGQTPPDKLIKYCICDEFSCDALLNNYLWASNPLDFNDPFDCPIQNWDLEMFSLENLKKIVSPEFHFLFSDSKIENRYVYFKIIWGSLGIVCLSENAPQNSDLFWGYYTNQKGFAISFNSGELIKSWSKPFHVEYLEQEQLDHFQPDIALKMYSKLLQWCTQKKKDWLKENEWRFIFNNCKVDPITFKTIPKTRMKTYGIKKAIIEVFLGFNFFNQNTFVQKSENEYVYITCNENTHQNTLLSYLAFPNQIKVKHLFMKNNRLELYPREC